MGENKLKKGSKNIQDLFKAKQERRKELAGLSIEEKVKILVQLQQIALPIYLSRGLKKRIWNLKN